MIRVSRLPLVAMPFLAAVAFLLTSNVSVRGQEAKLSKSDLQDMYMTYLKKEGYSPSVDEDGDIKFKYEGFVYFIIVNDDDPEFFRLIFPNFWEIESEAERQKVLVAAHDSTMKTKVAKVFMVKDNVWASIEIFVESPAAFQPVFKRSLSALRTGVNNFVEKMRE